MLFFCCCCCFLLFFTLQWSFQADRPHALCPPPFSYFSSSLLVFFIFGLSCLQPLFFYLIHSECLMGNDMLVFFVLFALFSFTILLPPTKHFKTLPLFLLNIGQRFWFMPWSPFAWMIVILLSLVSAKKPHLNLLQIRQNSAARITSTPSSQIILLVIQLY